MIPIKSIIHLRKRILQRIFIFFLFFIFLIINPFSKILSQDTIVEPVRKLTHHMAPWEKELQHLIGKDFVPTSPPTGPIRNVAEFEQMQGVLIRYPFGISYEVIAEMAEDINVVTIVSSTSQQNTVLNNYIANGVNTANCSFLIAPSDSYWARDYGPWYIFDGNDQCGIVDFPYNRPSRPNDDEIPVEMAAYLGINLFGMDVIHTGGNYMTDGNGISSSSDLVWDENPSLSHNDIDQAFLDYLDVHTYHVVPDPNNTYIDHIDCWGKFLDVDKVLIREVPTSHAQYDEIEATADYYASQTCSYGTPFQVFRVYTPNDQPYTNSIILNKKVIVPITGSSWDDDALQSYEDAMPGYEIVGKTGTWESTDALHCRAKGIADVGMLHIHHFPILGDQPVQTDYQIQADLTAHSGQTIYADSVFIIYKINGGIYDTTLMSYTGGKSYMGQISGLGFGDEVAYYIFVADQSGRNTTHPLIGVPDPHVFYVGQLTLPDILVDPGSFEVTVPPDASTVEQMTLSNLGQLGLDYSITKQYINKSSKAYCSSSGGGSDEFIQNVTIGSINNTTTQDYYSDYTAMSTVVNVGESYPITITNGDPNWATDQCGVWVDWNQNEDFTDDDPITINGSPGVGPYTADIIPPVDALPGMARMRIQILYSASPDPCLASFSYGEVEDYSLDVNNNFVDWLTINPLLGSVAGQGFANIDLTFNSTDLEEGDYYADVTITSNDPDQSQIIVPVHLIVSGTRYVDLKIFLEGPFVGTEMTTHLNSSGIIPFNQPYNISPWNYPGTESVASIPNAEITDWILVEFRDTTAASLATNETILETQAAFLLKDGSVVGTDGSSILQLNNTVKNQLFVVIWHRNHLGILSANPLSESGGIYSYDFSSGLDKVYGDIWGYNEMFPGIWGMVAGDGYTDDHIDSFDKENVWTSEGGTWGYKQGDFNLDTQIDNKDKNNMWYKNINKFSHVPE